MLLNSVFIVYKGQDWLTLAPKQEIISHSSENEIFSVEYKLLIPNTRFLLLKEDGVSKL